MWDMSKAFNATVVFAEHRYYGKSVPFGEKSYDSLENIRYLSSEQALADYVYLIDHLKKTIPGADRSAVIAFGGSYGAELAAWIRIKYPHIVHGFLALFAIATKLYIP